MLTSAAWRVSLRPSSLALRSAGSQAVQDPRAGFPERSMPTTPRGCSSAASSTVSRAAWGPSRLSMLSSSLTSISLQSASSELAVCKRQETDVARLTSLHLAISICLQETISVYKRQELMLQKKQLIILQYLSVCKRQHPSARDKNRCCKNTVSSSCKIYVSFP